MGIIDISQQYVKGICDLKCDYSFKYQKSNSIATNKGSRIQISYEDTGIPPVTYNNIKFNVSMIELTYPSSILYNGVPALANLTIVHNSVKDGSMLFVIIPITLSETTSKGSTSISEIVKLVALSAPNDGEKVTLNLPDFSLQDIVPKKPFYTGSFSFNLILFDLKNAIPMSQTTYSTLNNIIQSKPDGSSSQLAIILESKKSSNEFLPLFYNSKGPNQNSGEEEIYISCQPTGNSEETENVTFQKTTNTTSTFQVDLQNLFNNPYFIYCFYAFIFIVLLAFLNIIINFISSGSVIIPFYTKKKSNS